MGNPITDSTKFPQFIYNECCCCLTLRSGTLAIAIFQIVVSILYLIGGSSRSGVGFIVIITTILSLIAGILLVIAYRQTRKDFLFYAVYLHLIVCAWLLLEAIIMFVYLFWGLAIASLIHVLLNLYFAAIIRSYAFEIESGPTGTNPA